MCHARRSCYGTYYWLGVAVCITPPVPTGTSFLLFYSFAPSLRYSFLLHNLSLSGSTFALFHFYLARIGRPEKLSPARSFSVFL